MRSPWSAVLPVIARRWSLSIAATVVTLIPVVDGAAQDPTPVWGEVFVNSEAESYLRLLQVAGRSGPHPMSLRGLGAVEVAKLAPTSDDHPWSGAYDYADGDARWTWVRPSVRLTYNSAFPYGANDGAVWTGRGLTASVQAGIAARYGPLSATFAPIAFRAQNRAFPLRTSGLGEPEMYKDARIPFLIDLPQRFGGEAYSRLDPGQSAIRLELYGLALGASTANQHWGPALRYPILLGSNAPGFLHTYLGTTTPRDIMVGRIHGRLVWGALEQSAYSPMPAGDRRFMSGAVATFSPAYLASLELGVARFFHLRWPEAGIGSDDILRPFEGLLKSRLSGTDPDAGGENQIASVFGRWVFPGSGFEVYGEFGREDHNHDLRDLILQPDHDSAYMLGFRKVWSDAPNRWTTLRGEVANGDVTHLINVREQYHFYYHSVRRQGHTHRGQLLGTPAIHGGSGSILAVDRYQPSGRWTVTVERVVRQEVFGPSTTPSDRRFDVIYSAGVESLFFGERFDLTAGIDTAWNLNRDFEADRFNLNLRLGVEARMP